MNKLLVTTFLFITITTISFAQWTSIGGPGGGGSIRSLFIDKSTTPHTIYADVNSDGQTEKGAYRSTDGGATWNRAIMDSTKIFAIDCFGVGPTGTTYAMGGYLYKSTNSGVTWSKQSTSSVGGASIAIESATIMYAGTYVGIYKSTDGGANWNALPFNYMGTTNLISAAPNILYAAINGYGVYKSTDAGATWKKNKNGMTDTTVTSIVMESSSTFYVGTTKGMFKTTDDGANWSAINNGFSAVPSITGLTLESAGIVYAGINGGLYKTTDGGANWSATGLTTGWVNYVASDGAGIVYTGMNEYANGGVFKTTNGGTLWQPVSPNKYTITDMVFNENTGTLYVLCRDFGLYKTTDNGKNWIDISKNLTNKSMNSLVLENSSSLYVAGSNANVFKTTDDGATWTDLSVDSTTLTVNNLLIEKPGTMYAGMEYGGIYKTTDGGVNWFKTFGTGYTSANNLLLERPGVLYGLSSGVIKSEDAGKTWVNRGYVTIGVELGYPQRLALESPGTMYAFMKTSVPKGIYKSTDSAKTWTAVNSGLSDWDISSFAIATPGVVFASSNSKGVFKTTNGGTNWTDVSTGIGDKQVKVLAMSSSSIYAGTLSGIFKTTRPTGVKENRQDNFPAKFELSQNYPNPFNPTTTISYQLSANSFSSLKVYDVLGKEIATLVNEEQKTGRYSVKFDAARLSSGMYFYRLQTGGNVEVKRMLLLK